MAHMWFWIVPLLLVAGARPSPNQTCMNFDPTSHLTNSTLRLREYIRANTTITLPGMDPSCNRTKQLIPVDACRVALTIPTTNHSSFILELFLPNPEQWTGRLLGIGNGGIDGCIKYEDIAYGLGHGFAVTGSNNGHNGTGGSDFLNNIDIIKDFSWRALHTSAVSSKILVNAFYQRAEDRSYYLGCSGGGRQGIQAASLFPDDYDGILVGAPGLNFNYMSAWRASFYTITGAANQTDFIQEDTWTELIHQEILKQCDALDGLEDGILEDPNLCVAMFRPEALLCNSLGSKDCLTSQQVETVRRVFSPLYGVDGDLIYPPMAPGAEVQATDRLLSGSPFPYSVDWYRYAVYSDPDWDPATWTINDIATAEQASPGDAKTWPADLSRFRDKGNRLVIYHGGADQQISGFNTERWYNYLSTEMNESSTDLDTFLRFFRVPGMGHCSGGVGAWQIGQNAAGAKGIPYQGRNNILAALVDWVEKGNAPDSILGTRFMDDNSSMPALIQRLNCRYPFRSTYNKTAAEEGTWDCQ